MGNYHTLDTDECSEGIDHCDMNAICNNAEGHHTCQCSEGYDGDGETCYGLLWLHFFYRQTWLLLHNVMTFSVLMPIKICYVTVSDSQILCDNTIVKIIDCGIDKW